MDSYQCLVHLTAGIVAEPLFHAFGAAAFLQFALFSVFEMRLMLTIWKARRPGASQPGWRFAGTSRRSTTGSIGGGDAGVPRHVLAPDATVAHRAAHAVLLGAPDRVVRLVKRQGPSRPSTCSAPPRRACSRRESSSGARATSRRLKPQYGTCALLCAWVALRAGAILAQAKHGPRCFLGWLPDGRSAGGVRTTGRWTTPRSTPPASDNARNMEWTASSDARKATRARAHGHAVRALLPQGPRALDGGSRWSVPRVEAFCRRCPLARGPLLSVRRRVFSRGISRDGILVNLLSREHGGRGTLAGAHGEPRRDRARPGALLPGGDRVRAPAPPAGRQARVRAARASLRSVDGKTQAPLKRSTAFLGRSEGAAEERARPRIVLPRDDAEKRVKITARACRASGTNVSPTCVLPRSGDGGARLPASFAEVGQSRKDKEKKTVCLTRRPPTRCVSPRSFRGRGSCRVRSRPTPRRRNSRGDRIVRGGLHRRGQHELRERDHREGVPLFRFRGIHVPPGQESTTGVQRSTSGLESTSRTIASPTSEHDRSARAPACAQPLSARASTSDRARDDCRQT